MDEPLECYEYGRLGGAHWFSVIYARTENTPVYSTDTHVLLRPPIVYTTYVWSPFLKVQGHVGLPLDVDPQRGGGRDVQGPRGYDPSGSARDRRMVWGLRDVCGGTGGVLKLYHGMEGSHVCSGGVV